MTSRSIEIQARDGGKFSGYLAVPEAGHGPGLVMAQEIFGINDTLRATADYFAEEGYTVLVPDLFWRFEPGIDLGYSEEDFKAAFDYYTRFDVDQGVQDLGAGCDALRALSECDGKVGVIGFCLGGKLAYLTAARENVDVAVSFYGVGIEDDLDESKNITCPMVLHFAGEDQFVPPEAVTKIEQKFEGNDDVRINLYPGVDHAFYSRGRDSYDRPSAILAHSRTIAALRREMGPSFDLSALWDLHCEHEFITRDVDATMATMVSQPYVNHVPTMTGGVGYEDLHRFYAEHFVNVNPPDTKLIPISRTIGADRVVDEILFCFTHTTEIDWMLPGCTPTGKYVEIPLVAIICFRGDKLYNEHIYWDQASVLVQVGLLNPDGLPVAGIDTAKKLVDETLPSNALMIT